MTALAGLSGLPQVTLPLAQYQGCPLGLSLIGPRGGDAMLLAVCPVNAQLDDCRLPDDTPLRALDLPYSLPSS